jgi:AcrR family transcriptional regulator
MSPRSSEQFKELRDASRQKILEASLELFGTKGYESTTISAIVKKAGISKGLIYHYFESKQDILKELVEYLMELGGVRMKGYMERKEELLNGNPKERLRAMLDLFFIEMRENYHTWSLILNLTVQVHHFQFIHDMAMQKMNGYLLLMTDLFKDLGYQNPESEARILGALFDGIGMQYFVINNEDYLNSIEKTIYEKYNLL